MPYRRLWYVVLVLCFATHVHAYRIVSSPSYKVPESERISATQLVARNYSILTGREPLSYISFIFSTDANIFISYAPNPTGDNTTFGSIKVSGTSETMLFYQTIDIDPVLPDQVSIRPNYHVLQSLNDTDAVLIEIELYRKNVVQMLKVLGQTTVVVLENVLYSHHDGDTLDTTYTLMNNTYGQFSTSDDSSLFVVDPHATLTIDLIDISVFNNPANNTIQFEVGRFNTSLVRLNYDILVASEMSLFVDELYNLTKVVRETDKPNTLCVASKTAVNVTTKLFSGRSSPVYELIPARSTCTKQPLPDRVPRYRNPRAAAEATRKPSISRSAYLSPSIIVAVTSVLGAFLL